MHGYNRTRFNTREENVTQLATLEHHVGQQLLQYVWSGLELFTEKLRVLSTCCLSC